MEINQSEVVSSLTQSSCLKMNEEGSKFAKNNSDRPEDSPLIPTIDYSMLVSCHPDQRLEAIHQLGKACLEYGYFVVINHGVPESLISEAIKGFTSFFDLPEQQKVVYEANNPATLSRWGRKDHNHISREFLFLAAHPHLHCPTNPLGFKEILEAYNERMREVGKKLLRGISKTLGLEESYIEKALEVDSGYDFYAVNDYPLSLITKSKLGQFPHHDPGLLILHVQDVSGGLQLSHHGKWVDADCAPNCIFITVADHLEVLTNGKYKSVLHQVALNNKKRRVTLPLFMGPSKDVIINPASELVDEDHPPKYIALTYKDCLDANSFGDLIHTRSCLKNIRLSKATSRAEE